MKKQYKTEKAIKAALKLRTNKLKRDIELGMSDEDRKNCKWVVYGKETVWPLP